MKQIKGMKIAFITIVLAIILITPQSFASKINPVVSPQIFEKAKQNNNWKQAFITGKDAQIVFMSVTPKTNPHNEIGMETHKFDQIIFIVEGQAKAILDRKNSIVRRGDLIFIPQGTAHNFINLSAEKPLKIISVYSATDIPASAVYNKKSDVPEY